MSDEPAIRVENVTKSYSGGDGTVTAVDDVSFSVERGSCVGLLGPNGAGKTTTMKMILGLIRPDAGTLEINGVDVTEDTAEVYRHTGAMLEGARNAYWRLTVRENLRYFASFAGHDYADVRDRYERLLSVLELEDRADTAVRHLSRGEKQKVSLAIALARGSDVALLDEPTLGLDVESSLTLRRELGRLVEEGGMTFLVSSHDMDVIEEICDRVIILRDGGIIADDPVGELLDVFDTQSYRVTLDGAVDGGVRRRLDGEYGLTDWDRADSTTTFTVSVDEAGFYRLAEDLEELDHSLVDFRSVDPDLEEVFLDLVDAGEEEREVTA